MLKMARKLGDVAIGLIILLFIIGGLSQFLIRADHVTGVNSGSVRATFGDLNSNLSGVRTDLETGLTTKTDETGTFEVSEDQQLEQRGGDSFGLINLISKNIITKFLTSVSRSIPGSAYTIAFIITLIGVSISILIIRAFWGENKI